MDDVQTRAALLERQEQRVQRRMVKLNALNSKNNQLSLLIIGTGVVAFASSINIVGWLGLLAVVVAGVGFWLVARANGRIRRSFLLCQTWSKLLAMQLARLQLRWDALPSVPARSEEDEEHPFDNDLDLSGERSLHRLLNTAVSFDGMMRLRDWLLERVPNLEEIRTRQALVRELIPMTRFRDKLMLFSLFATRVSSEPLDGERLVTWLDTQAAIKQPFSTFLIAMILAALFYLSLILYVLKFISPLFVIVAIILCAAWYLLKRNEQLHLTQDMDYQRYAFGQLRQIFEYLEKYPYAKQSRLKSLCEPFYLHGDRCPSILLKKMGKIMERTTFARSTEGWFFLNIFIPIGAYTAYQLDKNKALVTEYLPIWLDVWYELEALSSLANFAYLHPDYTFPELVVGKKQEQLAVFEATALGHPLINEEKKVTNDFQLDHLGEIMLITGSNMAGKSTFLRTLGINLCLAYAGGVVNASRLRLSLFEIYACIRVTDSLADGYSYFYAEVKRLKGLLTEFERGTEYPLFFLIDEIFKGTNNYERLIGSEAYIRALVGKNCVGAISTHDLELVKLSESLTDIKNYHFREDVINGHMVFDYILRSGPSPTRNALKIMQMEGLPVKWDATPSVFETPTS